MSMRNPGHLMATWPSSLNARPFSVLCFVRAAAGGSVGPYPPSGPLGIEGNDQAGDGRIGMVPLGSGVVVNDQVVGPDGSITGASWYTGVSTSGYAGDWVANALVFASKTSRSVLYGTQARKTDTTALNGSGAPRLTTLYVNAQGTGTTTQLAELHLFNTAITDAQFSAIRAGTIHPRNVVGWVDGFSFRQGDSGLVSATGVMTLSKFDTSDADPLYLADHPTMAAYVDPNATPAPTLRYYAHHGSIL